MIPVNMTVMHNPPDSIGDCFRCCIASILELPADKVPHVMGGANWDDKSGQWFKDLNAFLKPMGLVYVDFEVPSDRPWQFDDIGEIYHVISGSSPNLDGTGHSVVAKSGIVVHDPAPSKLGLSGPYTDGELAGKYQYGLLIWTGRP